MQLYEIQNKGNRYCGPAAISAIAGITTAEAAALIRARTGRSAIKSTHDHEVSAALSALGFTMTRFTPPLNSTAAYKTVNLRRWAQDFARGSDVYLVSAGQHWILVQGRHAMCGKTINLVAIDDHPHVRMFVKKAYRITKARTVAPAAVIPKKPASEASARRKAKALATRHGIRLERLNHDEAFPLEVWPKGGIGDTAADPYYGDHYVDSWSEVLERVQRYVDVLRTGTANPEAEALALADQHGITIEQDEHGNRTIWVYPPDSLDEEADEFVDAHFVDTWPEALARVQAYVAVLTKGA